LVKPSRTRSGPQIGRADDTFLKDIRAYELARNGVQPLIEKVWAYCEANRIAAKTVTLKVKYPTSRKLPASKTAPSLLASIAELERSMDLLHPRSFPYKRAFGFSAVTLASLVLESPAEQPQLSLAF
jgi:DNA polymerase IV